MSPFDAQLGHQRRACDSGSTGNGARAWSKRMGAKGIAQSRLGLWILALVSTLASGCARRAYNDVYVENMAAEIRDLEDQLYEFDGEYRSMEQQLESLRTENARLRGAIPAQPPASRSLRQEVVPRGSNDGIDSNFFVPRGETKSTPSSPNRVTPSPAPSLEAGPLSPSDSVPKSIVPGGSSGSPPASVPGSAPSTLPSGNLPSLAPPTLPPGQQPVAPLPAPKPAPGADQFNPNDLAPPKIDLGEPMPPSVPPIGTNINNQVTTADNDLELELGQIKLPAQLASARSTSQADESLVRSSQIHPAAEMPEDTRIVEVKFHPTLCRAVNSDQQGDDDGLYLVLQPYNSSGEFVPLPADLMVLALDLSREEKKATIGRWTLSAADVKSKMNPIGSSQGIHLSLSFSGPAPQCDRVLVFAYYTLADGRRVVAEHEVMLNNLHRQHAVWVPRSKSEVRTASHEMPARR